MSQEFSAEAFAENLQGAFAQMDKYMDQFDRNAYKSAFDMFLEEEKPFLDMLSSFDEETLSEDIVSQIAKAVSASAAKCMEGLSSKSKKDKMQMNVNLFMVTYILPAILENCSKKTGPVITGAICDEWKNTFKGSHIQAAHYYEIDGGFKRKLCYITTATCVTLGLSEDCEELRLMKAYRDNYLMHQPYGPAYIKEYYNIAPTIVKRIASSGMADEIYKRIYETYLSECVRMIKNGENEACFALYTKMVNELKGTYVVTSCRA